MILRSGTFEEMLTDIRKDNKKILIFGAGVIGTVTVPNIMYQYNMLSRVDCYLDNDMKNQGTCKRVIDRDIPIYGLDYAKDKKPEDYIIVLAISRFSEVLDQLEGYEWTDNWECYLAPMMCLISFRQAGGKGVCKDVDAPIIPKKLHYMWLGGKSIPNNLKKCMDSWLKYCPDYEVIRWDENNYDIKKHPYMKQAYEHKMFGFVPDYARIDILYHEGGMYLDTDVEIKRPLDELLYQEAFCGVEKWQTLNLGGLSGSVRGQSMMKQLLDAREKIDFINPDGSLNKRTCGFYDTCVLLNNGYRINGAIQNIGGMNVYTSDYFHPYDYMSGKMEMTSDTFSVHHFNGGWLDDNMRGQNEMAQIYYDRVYEKTMKNMAKLNL